MKKIKRILLVDDSKATNFFNKTILLKSDYVEEVFVATNGEEALEFIDSNNVPEIIFLDINMPIMNGWEFLKEFHKLEMNNKAIVVLMIGAKLGSEEEVLLHKYPEVKERKEKMLTKQIIEDLVAKYFSDEPVFLKK